MSKLAGLNLNLEEQPLDTEEGPEVNLHNVISSRCIGLVHYKYDLPDLGVFRETLQMRPLVIRRNSLLKQGQM